MGRVEWWARHPLGTEEERKTLPCKILSANACDSFLTTSALPEAELAVAGLFDGVEDEDGNLGTLFDCCRVLAEEQRVCGGSVEGVRGSEDCRV